MDEQKYKEIMGLNSVDVGSVSALRKEINKRLVARGGKKLKGYKHKWQLKTILKKL